TSHRFEYGPSAGYGSQTSAASAGSGAASVAVSAAIDKLTPATLYHFRVVASNATGTSYGPDRTFTTSASPLAGNVWAPLAARPRPFELSPSQAPRRPLRGGRDSQGPHRRPHPVGERQPRSLQHPRGKQHRDGARHLLGDGRPLRRHADGRREGRGQRS